jgi:hypothetical protein
MSNFEPTIEVSTLSYLLGVNALLTDDSTVLGKLRRNAFLSTIDSTLDGALDGTIDEAYLRGSICTRRDT